MPVDGGAWPGLRQWRQHRSSAPEGPAQEPRPGAPAQAAGALNCPTVLPEGGRSGGTPGSNPVNVAARAGLTGQQKDLRPFLRPEAAASREIAGRGGHGRSGLRKTAGTPEPRTSGAGPSDAVGAPLGLLVPPRWCASPETNKTGVAQLPVGPPREYRHLPHTDILSGDSRRQTALSGNNQQ
ncbi:hypothetical protein NDU88_003812 [Pleurodeles waltl]|uniref:Uncharacterized protein n=1 Tax=Pleurodeles waltl TaxID=8319 RepID=A0AAV7VH06_PLEWA|nr:hypothetical protein NDU88_003812 [Pleurodeles waltl]